MPIILHEGDDIVISGKAGDGIYYERLPCMIATISPQFNTVSVNGVRGEHEPSIKVWPKNGNIGDGKLWFRLCNITDMELVDKDFGVGRSITWWG